LSKEMGGHREKGILEGWNDKDTEEWNYKRMEDWKSNGRMEDEKNFIAQLMELCYIYSESETCSQVFVST